VVFKISGTEEALSNSIVKDPPSKMVFRVESDKKHTNVLASDGTIITTFEWNHSDFGKQENEDHGMVPN